MASTIDQKGKIFGLINVIDFIVILLLLSFVALIFIGYRVVSKPENAAYKKWINVQIKLVEIEPELVDVINVGDVEKDLSKMTIGKLTAISSVKVSKVWVIVDNQKLSTIDHPTKRDVIISAEILCTRKDGVWYYKSAPVKINNMIMFETELYNLPGLVIKMAIDYKRES